MKTPVIKQRLAHFLVFVCLGAAPAALGQTLPASPADSGPEFAWQKPLAQPPSLSLHPSAAHVHSRSMTFNPTPLSAEQQAAIKQAYALLVEAAADQHAGCFAQAEAKARQGLAVEPMNGANAVVLAMALESEGKTQEALQVYQSRLITQDQRGLHGNGSDLLPYALLLLQSGRWAQAVAAYNAALPILPSFNIVQQSPRIVDQDVIIANSRFSPDVPEPDRLALMIHLARGVVFNATEDWAREPQNTEAFAEYGKALRLAPNSALANFYYGIGWQKLSPAEQEQFGSIQQAKAALTKAVRLAKGPLKVKAQKALLVAMKTK